MSAKTTTVNIRVAPETKARWVEAAGGTRRLSAWITELVDAAASDDAAEKLVALGAQAKLAQAALPLHTPVLPRLPSDRTVRDDEARSVLGAAGDAPEVAGRRPAVVSSNVGTPSDAATADQGDPGAVVSGKRPDAIGGAKTPPVVLAEECPRWVYHRKGVYCGTCKQVN